MSHLCIGNSWCAQLTNESFCEAKLARREITYLLLFTFRSDGDVRGLCFCVFFFSFAGSIDNFQCHASPIVPLAWETFGASFVEREPTAFFFCLAFSCAVCYNGRRRLLPVWTNTEMRKNLQKEKNRKSPFNLTISNYIHVFWSITEHECLKKMCERTPTLGRFS